MERRPPLEPCSMEACIAARLASSVFSAFNRMFSEAVTQELISEDDAEKAVSSINEVACNSRCIRLEMAAADLREMGYFRAKEPEKAYEKKGREGGSPGGQPQNLNTREED